MDALLEYLHSSNRFKGRLFVGEAPQPVFLAWANFEALPKLSGITIVKQSDSDFNGTINYKTLIDLIKAKSSEKLPIIEVTYSPDLSEFDIDGKKMDNVQAADFLSTSLKIKIGKNAAKKPNNPGQINDPFHLWSRMVFDGIDVRKVDIDAIIFNPELTGINAIVEIKRSKKVPVGTWLPYQDDYWNYIICFSLSKILHCDFVTFHHELIGDGEKFSDDTRLDAFAFEFASLISQETFTKFKSNNNRRSLTGLRLTS